MTLPTGMIPKADAAETYLSTHKAMSYRLNPNIMNMRLPIHFQLQGLFLFRHLSPQQIGDVIRVIKRKQAVKGDVIIRQGDEGDKFYMVDSGEFDVSQAKPSPIFLTDS